MSALAPAPEEIRARVAKGAAFLDENDPDWWRPDVRGAIDLDPLDMTSTTQCILGQRCPVEVLAEYGVEGRYYAYARHLSRITGSLEDWADEHGFLLMGTAACDPAWDELAAEWRRIISGRRAAA